MKASKLREKSFPVSIDFGDGDIVKMSMRPHVDGVFPRDNCRGVGRSDEPN